MKSIDQNLHNEHAYCDLHEDINFKGSDSSGFFVCFSFCDSEYVSEIFPLKDVKESSRNRQSIEL